VVRVRLGEIDKSIAEEEKRKVGETYEKAVKECEAIEHHIRERQKTQKTQISDGIAHGLMLFAAGVGGVLVGVVGAPFTPLIYAKAAAKKFSGYEHHREQQERKGLQQNLVEQAEKNREIELAGTQKQIGDMVIRALADKTVKEQLLLGIGAERDANQAQKDRQKADAYATHVIGSAQKFVQLVNAEAQATKTWKESTSSIRSQFSAIRETWQNIDVEELAIAQIVYDVQRLLDAAKAVEAARHVVRLCKIAVHSEKKIIRELSIKEVEKAAENKDVATSRCPSPGKCSGDQTRSEASTPPEGGASEASPANGDQVSLHLTT